MSTQIPHVIDDPEAVWLEHGVLSQPTWVFVAANGEIERSTAAFGPQRLLERIESLAA